MAIKHRKLHPSSVTNQTTDCGDNCEPCIYDCFTNPDYYSAPLPQFPPPPPSVKKGGGSHASLQVIIIVTLLGSVLLLLSCCLVIRKYCFGRFRPSSSQPGTTPDEEFLDQNHGPIIDHPIWYINTIGLQPSVINSITVVQYNKDGSLIEGTDCSVCLNEFQEEETLRLLPKCNHAFHIPCIDTWLRSHTNCPLCRAGIFSNPWNVSVPSNDQNSSVMGSNEITQMENSENIGELDQNQVGEVEVCENRTETEEGSIVIPESNEFKQIIRDRCDHRPLRRSVSMDLEYCSIDFEGRMGAPKFDATMGNAAGDSSIRKLSSSSIANSLHKGVPFLMKRSFSYSGRSV